MFPSAHHALNATITSACLLNARLPGTTTQINLQITRLLLCDGPPTDAINDDRLSRRIQTLRRIPVKFEPLLLLQVRSPRPDAR